ncbi:MAG TPA: hypothetical protein VF400_06345 [Anaeromyxobacteraceae bacterium]
MRKLSLLLAALFALASAPAFAQTPAPTEPAPAGGAMGTTSTDTTTTTKKTKKTKSKKHSHKKGEHMAADAGM